MILFNWHLQKRTTKNVNQFSICFLHENNVKITFFYFFAVQPLISRQQRAELTKVAEKASIDVFATNLKQLLLMSPVKGERILGIDPGFSNGCKLALISECADVLDTAVIYPHTNKNKSFSYGQQVAKMLVKHK